MQFVWIPPAASAPSWASPIGLPNEPWIVATWTGGRWFTLLIWWLGLVTGWKLSSHPWGKLQGVHLLVWVYQHGSHPLPVTAHMPGEGGFPLHQGDANGGWVARGVQMQQGTSRRHSHYRPPHKHTLSGCVNKSRICSSSKLTLSRILKLTLAIVSIPHTQTLKPKARQRTPHGYKGDKQKILLSSFTILQHLNQNTTQTNKKTNKGVSKTLNTKR